MLAGLFRKRKKREVVPGKWGGGGENGSGDLLQKVEEEDSERGTEPPFGENTFF